MNSENRYSRWIGIVLLAASVLMSGVILFSQRIEASIPSKNFEPNLLLTAPYAEPIPEKIRLLESLIATHHVVKKGETMFSLAQGYGTNFFSIQSSNHLKEVVVSPGQELIIPNRAGMVYSVKKGDTLAVLLPRFHRGRSDKQNFLDEVIEANGLPSTYAVDPFQPLVEGTFLFLPRTYLDLRDFDWPLVGRLRVTSRFGRRYHPILHRRRFHDGWDIAKPYGTSVRASRKGVVTFAGWEGGYGQLVIIRHADGFTTRYGHLSEIDVEPGQVVKKGRIIGRVGSSGLSTGPHLHFEVRDPNDRRLNPGRYLY